MHCIGYVVITESFTPPLDESVTSLNWNLTTVTTGFDSGSQIVDVARVRFAYVTIGSIILVASLLFTVAFCRDCFRRNKNAKKRVRGPPVDVAVVKLVDINSNDRPNGPLKLESRLAKNRDNKPALSAAGNGSVQCDR